MEFLRRNLQLQKQYEALLQQNTQMLGMSYEGIFYYTVFGLLALMAWCSLCIAMYQYQINSPAPRGPRATTYTYLACS